jgi:hypothetical protein
MFVAENPIGLPQLLTSRTTERIGLVCCGVWPM